MSNYLQQAIKSGDTLGKIARANGVSVGELIALNGIADPDRIAIGQILNIRRLSDSSYVVQKGDSLSTIAAHFGVTVAALAKANGIANPNLIAEGASLSIPTGAPGNLFPPITLPPAGGAMPKPGAAAIAAARIARSSVRDRSAGLCYRYVKRALLAGDAVDHYLGGTAAIEAGPLLVRQGFVDILNLSAATFRSPYDAPEGAVIVYKATPTATDRNRIYGHIELRTADGFASDYFSPRARTGARENGLALNGPAGRAVAGVYIKPETGEATAAASPPLLPATPPPAPASSPAPAINGPYGAANLLLPSVNGKYHAAIVEAAQRTDLAPQTIAAIIDAEAAKIAATGQWNANSRAATSSATGLTQFLDGTWRGEARRAGGLLNAEAKNAGVVDSNDAIIDDLRLLKLRFDPRVAILAGADYAVANLAILRQAGVLPATLDPAATAKLAYLAHHEGPGRAIKFLRGQMGYVTPAILAANVPNPARRQTLLAAADGNVGTAYRQWFAGYVDANIDVTQFMANSAGVVVPYLARFFV